YARSTTESHEKFQYDLYYIKNRSFFLDLGILLKTFQLFFKKEK
ncbi:sugar transferase, partial [bacterium]|nr:sugar transferase [bacterium]